MSRKLVRSLVVVAGLSTLGALTGDRSKLQAAPGGVVCLECTGPQCWCEERQGQFCDSASDKICKCNAEEE